MPNQPTYKELQLENELLKKTVLDLMSRVDTLEQDFAALKVEKSNLEQELATSKVKKNSKNSGKPPSTDLSRKNKSLRGKSDKPSGGQKKHKGHHLEMSLTPDYEEKLIPDFCNVCGDSLKGMPMDFHSKRQVIDLPEITPICTEYQNYQCHCNCGHVQQATYPKGVNAPTQYGNNIRSLVGYLSVYQYLPFKRMSKMFREVFNVNLSEGSVNNILNKLGDNSEMIYESIRLCVEESEAVGGDETGVKVNGQRWWGWVWQTLTATFIAISSNRGQQTIDKWFPKGFLNAIFSSDRWKAQLNTTAKGHQLCLAHLLRNLIYLIELEKNTYAIVFKNWMQKTIALKKEHEVYQRDDPLILPVEQELKELLEKTICKDTYPKTTVFFNSMREYHEYLLPFLYFKEVSPDNNSSERAIRNFKVKLKISGQFKTGQDNYAKLRSVVDTCIKRDIPIFNAFQLIANI